MYYNRSSKHQKQQKNNTLLLVGNIADPASIKENSTKTTIGKQLDVIEDFNGQIILTPGYNEMESNRAIKT